MKAFLIMIAPNSLVRQKKGAQGEEEGAGDRRKRGQIRTPTPGADAPTDPTQSGVSDARSRRKHERWCGEVCHTVVCLSTGEAEGAKD